jgi:predicted Zn-dependent protease
MWFVIAFIIQFANGYELTESPQADELRWAQMPIQWELDTTDSPEHLNMAAQREAISAAFATWQDVSGTTVEFEDVTEDANANENIVYWERNWTANSEMLALTTTISNSDGVIVGFKIALNAQHPQWSINGTEGMDLQNALTHEVGHVLGLDHTEEREEATMFPSTEEGERSKRDLDWDDKEGLRYLYPITAAAGFACSSAAAAPSAIAAALPLLAIFRRRRN